MRAALSSRASARSLGLKSILGLWNSEVAFFKVTLNSRRFVSFVIFQVSGLVSDVTNTRLLVSMVSNPFLMLRRRNDKPQVSGVQNSDWTNDRPQSDYSVRISAICRVATFV